MRAIKFRAWDKTNKSWVYSDHWESHEGGGLGWFFSMIEDTSIGDASQGYELMQFTGLHDKNGKEVFEDDLWKDIDGQIYHICWGEYTFKFFAVQTPLPMVMIGLDSLKNGEVIGNIYENPDLLGDKK